MNQVRIYETLKDTLAILNKIGFWLNAEVHCFRRRVFLKSNRRIEILFQAEELTSLKGFFQII